MADLLRAVIRFFASSDFCVARAPRSPVLRSGGGSMRSCESTTPRRDSGRSWRRPWSGAALFLVWLALILLPGGLLLAGVARLYRHIRAQMTS